MIKDNNYAFIDSQNLNLGVQSVGFKIDWRKFRQFLTNNYGVEKAYMFIGYIEANENLYEYMYELGYLVVLKPTIDFKSNEEENDVHQHKAHEPITSPAKQTTKGNIDADLVLHVMKELNNFNQALIVSGDGDFYSLIEYLIQINKLKNLMTPNWKSSTLLKPFEEYIVRLDKYKQKLAYREHRTRKPKI